MSDYTEKMKILRNYTVTLENGERHHVTANRFMEYDKNRKRVVFEGDRLSEYAKVASFENVALVTDDASVVSPYHPTPTPAEYRADMRFTVNAHEGDIKRHLERLFKDHSYKVNDLEVTQTQRPWSVRVR